MAQRQVNFIKEVQTLIMMQLQAGDAWSALKAEYDTFTANNTPITQPHLDAVFGVNGLLLPDWLLAIAAEQAVVDSLHVPATAAKLYRLKG